MFSADLLAVLVVLLAGILDSDAHRSHGKSYFAAPPHPDASLSLGEVIYEHESGSAVEIPSRQSMQMAVAAQSPAKKKKNLNAKNGKKKVKKPKNAVADPMGKPLADPVTCDAGWTLYTGTNKCYRLTGILGTWFVQKDKCLSFGKGSTLTSVHSQAESKWIDKTFATSSGLHAWVGLSQTSSANLAWEDGTPVDYTWWMPGREPTSTPPAPEDSCVEICDEKIICNILALIYTPGQMNQYECSEKIDGVCSYDPSLTTSTTTTTTTTTPTTTTTTPTPAPATTTTASTTTTTPTTTSTTTQVTTTPTTTTASTTTTTPTTTSTTTQEKTTPTTKTTTTKATTTTTPTTTTTKKSKTTTTKKATTKKPVTCTSKCAAPWVEIDGNCYAQVKMTGMSWGQANQICTELGAMLGEVTSASNDEALRRTFDTNNEGTYIGQMWIALKEPWKTWKSGASATYTNWGPGQPNNAEKVSPYCATFIFNSNSDNPVRGSWNDVTCSTTLIDFALCQKPAK